MAKQELENFREFLKKGWTDVWRKRNPDKREYTYYMYC